jgi:hypothetical protein
MGHCKKGMSFAERMERIIDKSVPLVLILLAVLIIAGLFIDLHHYEPWVAILDIFIVAFFVVDLIFKWTHTREVKKFLKLYWLDILAVFPFYLLFRVYLFTVEIAKVGEEAQKVLHEAVLLKETKFARFAGMTKSSTNIARIRRFAQRMLRFARIETRILFGHFAHRHAKVQKKI